MHYEPQMDGHVRRICDLDLRVSINGKTGSALFNFTKPPSGPKMAQLKSRRSLIFRLTLVFCRVLPICSAILMKRWPNTDNCTGSTRSSSFLDDDDAVEGFAPLAFTSMMTWSARIVARELGRTRSVCVWSRMIAGPLYSGT